MANTIITTNRTIEISSIDSDYMMPPRTNVQSVIFIPGISLKGANYVNIIENSPHVIDPVKIKLINLIGDRDPREWIFNQRLQLGFNVADCYLDTWCRIIFNIGELHYSNRVTNIRISSMNTRMSLLQSRKTDLGPITAFLTTLDNFAAARIEGIDLTKHLSRRIVFTNPDTGFTCSGYIKTADTIEELGLEKVTDGGFTILDDETGATAFYFVTIDGSAAVRVAGVDLTAYLGKFVVFTDSTGKKLWGYIKAADIAEALGTKYHPEACCTDLNNDQDVTIGWNQVNSTIDSIAGGDTGNCLEITSVGVIPRALSNTVNIPEGTLLKLTGKVKSGTAGNKAYSIYRSRAGVGNLGAALPGTSNIAWVQRDGYSTVTAGYTANLSILLQNTDDGAGTMLFDDVSLQQVTRLGIDAITIVSTPGGATRNWTGMDAGFDPNDAAMTFEIYNADWIYGIGWLPVNGKAIAIAGVASNLEQDIPVEAGKLYKSGFDITRVAGSITPQIGAGDGAAISLTNLYEQYITATTVGNRKFQKNAAFIGTVDNDTVKEVINLGIDAVHIVSVPRGDIQNWTNIDVGFDPNDPTMTVVIYH